MLSAYHFQSVLLSVRFFFCLRSAPSAQPNKPVVLEIISKLSPAGYFLVW